MNILAFDLGTTTGWAMWRGPGMVHSGSQSFKPARFDGGGMRYLRFSRWLDELLPKRNADPWRVAFEEVRRHQGTDAAHAYGGFMAHLTAWCERRCIPYEGVPVATIKKHVTGKGNASKVDVLVSVQLLGYAPCDDNEADALAIMSWAVAHQPPGISASRVRKVVPRARR